MAFACMLPNAGFSQACEAEVACDCVQAIHVGKGREHLKNGEAETFYSVAVIMDADKSGLKEVFASCLHDTILVRIGTISFELPKSAISPAGNWIGAGRSTDKRRADANL